VGILIGSRALEVLDFWVKEKSIKKVVLADNCCEELIDWAFDNIQNVTLTDIDPITKEINLDHLKFHVENNKIGKNMLIIWVWPYGLSPSLEKFKKIKSWGDCLILEDKCLARPILPSEYIYNGICDAELYSTGYSKYCDLLFGGWLKDNKTEIFYNSNILNEDIYFENVAKRRLIVDRHKVAINHRLDEITKNVKISNWNPKTWRYCLEVKDPILYSKIIFNNGAFSSCHYNTRKYLSRYISTESKKHKKHIINLFNDLRADSAYIDKIEKATDEYLNVLHNSL
tara:strand:+ start:1093 stop:1947 length:855 start_codon:yes stop_codon:yes gene_type:complete